MAIIVNPFIIVLIIFHQMRVIIFMALKKKSVPRWNLHTSLFLRCSKYCLVCFFLSPLTCRDKRNFCISVYCNDQKTKQKQNCVITSTMTWKHSVCRSTISMSHEDTYDLSPCILLVESFCYAVCYLMSLAMGNKKKIQFLWFPYPPSLLPLGHGYQLCHPS